MSELDVVAHRLTEQARAEERRRIGLWLEQQGVISREAPSGVHPEAATRTHAAAFSWAAARVLADQVGS